MSNPITNAQRIEQYVKAFQSRSRINEDDIIVGYEEEASDRTPPADTPETVYIRDGRFLWTFYLARYSEWAKRWKLSE